MLKFIKHNMETIGGIEIFPIIALVIFFLFFIGLLVWVITTKKQYVDYMEQLPLEDDNEMTMSKSFSHKSMIK